MEACIELYINHKPENSKGLKGQDFLGESTIKPSEKQSKTIHKDAFEATPKLHCGMDVGEGGNFSIYVGLDSVKVFNSLRGAL